MINTYQGRIQSRTPLCVLPERAVPQKKERKREPANWRPMTGAEQRMALALGQCTFPPATAQKRFARDIAAQASADEPKITDKQRAYLHLMVHRYRRQIPTEILEMRLDDSEANPRPWTEGQHGT